jgi:hypothetical protein
VASRYTVTAHGLVLGGGVPPGVDDEHDVGGRQVQTEAAGLQADEEEVALAALKSEKVLGRTRTRLHHALRAGLVEILYTSL